jgi:AcrR family transcriptional regulator
MTKEKAMASDQTRTAILNAAERLYADRGFGDVTLRDIVAAANVNLAAVNYHFGSKDELIAELFVTRSLATNRERLQRVKAAEERRRPRQRRSHFPARWWTERAAASAPTARARPRRAS